MQVTDILGRDRERLKVSTAGQVIYILWGDRERLKVSTAERVSSQVGIIAGQQLKCILYAAGVGFI